MTVEAMGGFVLIGSVTTGDRDALSQDLFG
jgi:hypothetical protein